MTVQTTLLSPETLWLDIPEAACTLRSSVFASDRSRWCGLLNQVSLAAVLEWLREETGSTARSWPAAGALASVHELVNGTLVECGGLRLLLVPGEQADREELRIPREWIDIPEWTADFYLPVEVDFDNGVVGLWGYATYQQVRRAARLDHEDRSYFLPGIALNPTVINLPLALECQVAMPARQAAPLATRLSPEQARNLIARLTPALMPRHEVPFDQWAALIVNGGWRRQLHERRLGLPPQWSVTAWLRQGIGELAGQSGWSMAIAPTGSRSSQAAGSSLVRSLMIAGQPYELRVLPLTDANTWRFALRNPAGRVPGGLKLRLLTEQMEAFANNEAVATTAVDELFIDVTLDPGDGLVWETEPQPYGYDREVLYFE